MSLRVSVVVPTYRRPDLLERCLAALVAQDFEPHSYEIIVADDAADPSVRRLVASWEARTRGAPMVRYVAVAGTRGPAGARNRGWEIATAGIIAFTDDDTIPRPDWLAEGCKAMTSGVTAVAGRVEVPLPAHRPLTDYELDIAHMRTAEFLTANCFVRRSALAAIGGFDERFTSAWREDSDLQFRLLEANGKVVGARNAVVEHPVRPMPFAGGIRQHRKIAFDALLYKKHPRLYRERIRRAPPWSYYLIVAALAATAWGAAARSPALAWGGFAAWLALTAAFCLKRLARTSRAPGHVAEMIVTSIAIPPVAVFWRLAGALRFRVFFL
ncbi:MAG TPA: glycosyltransferase [Usitatibacter sp.]|nr:glycosyltransferase [Usitatibacter sp.]